MKSIAPQTYEIDAPIEKVWMGLTEPEEIEKWGGGPAEMDGLEGTEFSLWGGDIYGTNTKVVEHKLLEQDWFGGEWEEASKVKFEFAEVDGKTKVVLTHENIPDEEADDIEDGWREYYMGPLKEYLEGRA